MTLEKLLGVLAGDEIDSRIELVQVADGAATPTLELRLQRLSADLGWCTHRRMRMAAGQISDLRRALNQMDPDAREATISASEKAAARSIRLVAHDSTERRSG